MSAKLCSLIPDNYARALKKIICLAKKTVKKLLELVSVSNPSSLSQINHVMLTSSSVSFSITRKITIGWLQKANEYSNVARLYDAFPGQSVPGVLPKGVDWTLEKNSRFLNFFRVYVPGVASPFPDINDSGDSDPDHFVSLTKNRSYRSSHCLVARKKHGTCCRLY
jgi:hypothetical protein